LERVISIFRISLISLFLLVLIPVSVFSQESVEPFGINVTISYIDVQLKTIGGSDYFAWWISGIGCGDTIGMEIPDVVHFVNSSNVPLDILADVFDNPDSMTTDTLWDPWTIALSGGINTIGFRWASAPDLAVPPFATAQVILSTPVLIENGVAESEDRYLFGWFLAPTEGEAGEHHRLLSHILITPTMVP